MKSDIEISRSTPLKPIGDIAQKLNIAQDDLIPFGRTKAKIPLKYLQSDKKGKLIMVTAITPNKAGVGKTVTSVGLSLGLNHIGKNALVALREPSLGPCFGMKGGAAGGGYAQVLPMEDINLHFTGDFHAITSANNMIAALVDNYRYWNKTGENTLTQLLWKRVLDVNDRMLRYIVSGLHGSTNGIPTETGFDITPASEIMALLCLSEDLEDLERRIDRIVVGYSGKKPVTVGNLGFGPSIVVLLREAIMPNLVQTTEHTPAIIHGGPFANIAHGCNSVIATKTALNLADYVVTESGFGSDLGAEKFFDIKCRMAGLQPAATVIVASLQAIKLHGGAGEKNIRDVNADALKTGLQNLQHHIRNLQAFGQNAVISINKYGWDTENEMNCLIDWCKDQGVKVAVNECFVNGGAGAAALAQTVADVVDNNPSGPINYAYDLNDSIDTKIDKVVKRVYGGSGIKLSGTAQTKLKKFEELGWGNLPVCIAKTQYSFSDDINMGPLAKDFTLRVEDLVINAGAGFVVAIAGDIMRMPGMPKESQALHIKLVNGEIDGLS